MRDGSFPLLWLHGPSGVGKSTVAWEIFAELGRSGPRTAYADIDQLALCYPADGDDPGNDRLKAANLAAVWPILREAGARCLVVSGILDTADAVRAYVDRLPGVALTSCRLRADEAELRNRIVTRGWQTQLADAAVRHAEALDRADIGELCVDTGGLSAVDVARLVRAKTGWPGPAAEITYPVAPLPVSTIDCEALPLLWLCGPQGVGKSAVGWEIFADLLRSGAKTAYVDLAQLGFLRPISDGDPDNHTLKARSLGALWANFRAAGARCLIVSGGVTGQAAVRRYAAAVPGTKLTVCRLHAGPAELTERILRRGRGEGPPIPGDELKGLPAEALHRLAERAAREADDLERAGIGDFRVDTDGLSTGDVARLVRARAGEWPGSVTR
ncbi:AAA family ATPase [Amycolatopsis sp. NPDC059027]|uniref:AAA family ATPase n=1 Tax=Amycolatopsis sp. NPDC059027 TaxID=3346709 RepID=UPI003673030A